MHANPAAPASGEGSCYVTALQEVQPPHCATPTRMHCAPGATICWSGDSLGQAEGDEIHVSLGPQGGVFQVGDIERSLGGRARRARGGLGGP